LIKQDQKAKALKQEVKEVVAAMSKACGIAVMHSEEDGKAIRNNPMILISFLYGKKEKVSDSDLEAEAVVSGSEEVRNNFRERHFFKWEVT
jgi:hypothetical protein